MGTGPVLDLWTFAQQNGDRAAITFVVLDAGKVVDVQKKSINTHGGKLNINGQEIALSNCEK
ncbi:MAG: hypothetical protein P1U87_01075 [Verrucomicrobiales bacterium]|nr:hypothetical protein [Verrucomicrobiales bacterium]